MSQRRAEKQQRRQRRKATQPRTYCGHDLDLTKCMECSRPASVNVQAIHGGTELNALTCDEHLELFCNRHDELGAEHIFLHRWR